MHDKPGLRQQLRVPGAVLHRYLSQSGSESFKKNQAA